MKEIQEEIESQQSLKIIKSPSYWDFIHYTYSKSPKFLKKILQDFYYPFKIYKKGREINKKGYILTGQGESKKWSLDFLNYSLSKNVKINTNLFPKQDEKEILNFVDNKIKSCLYSMVEEKTLQVNSISASKMYGDYLNNLVLDNQTILFRGRKYFFNKKLIETSLFYHRLGLDFIPKKNLESIRGKTILDCGACFGDSCIILNQLFPRQIIAFEPNKLNFLKLKEIIKKNKLPVRCIQKGMGEKEKIIRFTTQGTESFIGNKGKEKINITKIDKFKSKEIKLIKMDIEGYELEAIKGAEKTIKENKPLMIVCLYHRGKDFFEIPNLLKLWVPEYKFRFLNLNKSHATYERVLIAYT